MSQLAFTIFGGTGDLTFRKLLPAFYNLMSEQKLEEDIRIIIIGRRDYSDLQYRNLARTWVKQFARIPYREQDFLAFANKIQYVKMNFTQEDAYQELNAFYEAQKLVHHIYYLAVAPRFFQVITDGLQHVAHAREGKVIIEKPFGEDLISAKALNQDLEAFFGAGHVLHIDHYLGKEMIRNIQTIRFMNPIFQQLWSNQHIEHVQISALESIGVGSRGDYYDKSGALMDMVQNHLFQIMSILAMEEPDQLYEQDMQHKQLAVLQALRPVQQLDIASSVVLGQYFGYQKEEHVALDSLTETYAALRLYIDNERWRDVPFYIRTGKKLDRQETEVVITFKKQQPQAEANVLVIKIQPTEGVYLQFNIKRPGESEDVILARMDFCQSCYDVHRMNTPEAYERLLLASISEDISWFSKWDQIETSWTYIQDLKQAYDLLDFTPYVYLAGSEGPEEAKDLLQTSEHTWFQSSQTCQNGNCQ